MNRRTAPAGWAGLWLFLLLLLAALPVSAEAERKRIILIQTMPVRAVLEHTNQFIGHLARLGYTAGANLELMVLRPDGDRMRAAAMLDEALAMGSADLVVTSATMASQVARERLKETSVPQLFFTVSDPVGAGLVPAVGAPSGANITGKVHTVTRRAKILMALRLLGLEPGERPVRFGYIHSSYPSAVGDARLLTEAAAQIDGVDFIPYRIAYRPVPEGLPAMLAAAGGGIAELEGEVDYWWEPSGPLGERPEFTRLLRDASRRPIVYGIKRESVQLGALFHVTPSVEATGREAAQLAEAILEGASPAEFIVAPANDVDLGVNLATAMELGTVIPSDLAELAGDNIFREKSP